MNYQASFVMYLAKASFNNVFSSSSEKKEIFRIFLLNKIRYIRTITNVKSLYRRNFGPVFDVSHYYIATF